MGDHVVHLTRDPGSFGGARLRGAQLLFGLGAFGSLAPQVPELNKTEEDANAGAAAGLGTGGFFVEDVVDPGVFALEDGHLPVRQVAPDPARLEELRIGGERRDWWLDRIRRCHAIL